MYHHLQYHLPSFIITYRFILPKKNIYLSFLHHFSIPQTWCSKLPPRYLEDDSRSIQAPGSNERFWHKRLRRNCTATEASPWDLLKASFWFGSSNYSIDSWKNEKSLKENKIEGSKFHVQEKLPVEKIDFFSLFGRRVQCLLVLWFHLSWRETDLRLLNIGTNWIQPFVKNCLLEWFVKIATQFVTKYPTCSFSGYASVAGRLLTV